MGISASNPGDSCLKSWEFLLQFLGGFCFEPWGFLLEIRGISAQFLGVSPSNPGNFCFGSGRFLLQFLGISLQVSGNSCFSSWDVPTSNPRNFCFSFWEFLLLFPSLRDFGKELFPFPPAFPLLFPFSPLFPLFPGKVSGVSSFGFWEFLLQFLGGFLLQILGFSAPVSEEFLFQFLGVSGFDFWEFQLQFPGNSCSSMCLILRFSLERRTWGLWLCLGREMLDFLGFKWIGGIVGCPEALEYPRLWIIPPKLKQNRKISLI